MAIVLFFFQAEDGIRDGRVTGVQTCALPILFDIGFSEILVIFVLALIVLGPEKLPRVVREVGRWVGRARAMARQFRSEERRVGKGRRSLRSPAEHTNKSSSMSHTEPAITPSS